MFRRKTRSISTSSQTEKEAFLISVTPPLIIEQIIETCIQEEDSLIFRSCSLRVPTIPDKIYSQERKSLNGLLLNPTSGRAFYKRDPPKTAKRLDTKDFSRPLNYSSDESWVVDVIRKSTTEEKVSLEELIEYVKMGGCEDQYNQVIAFFRKEDILGIFYTDEVSFTVAERIAKKFGMKYFQIQIFE